jgi:hypothetical protein
VVWLLGEPEPGLVGDVSVTGATVVADALEPLAELVRGQPGRGWPRVCPRSRSRPATPPHRIRELVPPIDVAGKPLESIAAVGRDFYREESNAARSVSGVRPCLG